MVDQRTFRLHEALGRASEAFLTRSGSWNPTVGREVTRHARRKLGLGRKVISSSKSGD